MDTNLHNGNRREVASRVTSFCDSVVTSFRPPKQQISVLVDEREEIKENGIQEIDGHPILKVGILQRSNGDKIEGHDYYTRDLVICGGSNDGLCEFCEVSSCMRHRAEG